jgi:hypothetical protein
MAATDISRTVGTENAAIKVGLGLTMESKANSTTKAEENVVSGVSSATAETEANAGVLNSSIEVGTNGTLTGEETGTVTAIATNTTGKSSASARNAGPTGGFIDNVGDPTIIQTGLNAVVVGSAKNSAVAEATTVGGSSDALADTGKVAGFENVGLAAGTGSSMTGSAVANSKASSAAVGLPLDPGNSTATAGSLSSLIKGIYNNDGEVKIAFGENGDLKGTAAGELTSTAANTNGAAKASSLMDQVAGIANDGDGLKISMGLTGDVVASGQLKSAATATTVTGPATAEIDVNTIGGLIDRREGSSLNIGTVGTLEAVALGQNTARAEAVTTGADELVQATVDNDEVIAVRFPKIAIGTDASVSAGAQSIQRATAIGVNNGGDPLARVAEGDKVEGIDGTVLNVGRDLQDFNAEAYLTGISSATGISSLLGSTALSGVGSKVAGVHDSPIVVGRDTDGVNALGESQLQSTATGVTGPALATAGSNNSSVSGLRDSDVSIGRNGDVAGAAAGLVISESATITGPSTALSSQEGRGIKGSTIKIGLSGDVDGASELGGSATSSSTTGLSRASLLLDSVGIDQTRGMAGAAQEGEAATAETQSLNHHNLWIGFDGNVRGDGVVANSTVKSSTITDFEVGAVALTDLDAIGIKMGHLGTITIGNKGNVTGNGDSGISKVEADNTNGPATASGTYDVFGITGDHSGYSAQGEEAQNGARAKIQAGPLGGNIFGSAVSEAVLGSHTTTGDATTGNTAVLVGINKVDLQAGLVGGANRISGFAAGDYNTNSNSVTGDATTTSKVKVAGLLGDRNTATLDGNVSGVATLTNTVLATTVSGIASATSNSSAVGIGGYDINILKDGVITASAISNSSATANSVNHALV